MKIEASAPIVMQLHRVFDSGQFYDPIFLSAIARDSNVV
jgi:hypothetical protein